MSDYSVRCCRGCPDCIGIGAHHQIRALNDRIAQLEAELTLYRDLESACRNARTYQGLDTELALQAIQEGTP